MVPGQAALAGLRLGHRHAMRFGKHAQGLPGLAVQHAAARHDQRPFGAGQQGHGLLQLGGIGRRAAQADQRRVEEIHGPVEGLGLHILRQRKAGGAALRRVGHDLDGARQGRQQLPGLHDAVEVARDRAQAVVGAQITLLEALHLLQDGIGQARGKDVPGQQQQRQARHMRQRGGGHQVGGAGADAGGHGHHALAEMGLGKGHGRMGHALFAVGAKGGQPVPVGMQGLAQPGHVAMPKDGEHAAAIGLDGGAAVRLHDLGPQGRQVADQRLADGQSHSACHGLPCLRCPPFRTWPKD